MLETTGYILLGALLATPLILANIRLAPRLGLIDWPKARGLAEDQIPIVGHSLVLFSLIAMAVGSHYFAVSPWFLTTAFIMAVMGHFDDRKPLPASDKMFFQIVCVSMIVLFDPSVREAMGERYGNWGTFWGIFFILGLINAINFIDGIDGLAGIVISVGALGFLLFSGPFAAFAHYGIFAALLVGMMAPFLYFNVVKRRGFLGNIGSYFFSYVLAVMHLSLPIDSPNPVARLSLAGLCFLIPIADAVVVCLSRVVTARSPFQADKGHLHHRLVQTSIALRYILLNFGLIELLSLGMAYFLATNEAIRGSSLPIAICLSHVIVVGMLIVLVEKASKRRLQGYLERLHTGEPIYFLKYRFQNEDGTPIGLSKLHRLEARVSAEIRVTDLCFVQGPDVLFLTLRSLQEPMRRVANRLEIIFRSEKIRLSSPVEEGEFLKVTEPQKLPKAVRTSTSTRNKRT